MTDFNIPEHLTDEYLLERKTNLGVSLSIAERRYKKLSDEMNYFYDEIENRGWNNVPIPDSMSTRYRDAEDTMRVLEPELFTLRRNVANIGKLLDMPPAQRTEAEAKRLGNE